MEMSTNREFDVEVKRYISSLSPIIPTCLVKVKATNNGPPPYTGDILEEEELLLWMDDEEIESNEERMADAKRRLQAQGDPLPEFWREKYIKKANTFWHAFYKRNTDKFYKDRHYLTTEFPEITTANTILEVGCGVGNAVLPLLSEFDTLVVHAVDFAESAIAMLRMHPLALTIAPPPAAASSPSSSSSSPSSSSSASTSPPSPSFPPPPSSPRLLPSVCDVCTQSLPVPDGSVDLVLCMFVLSAIAPRTHPLVLAKLAAALKPGGRLCFRDYGRLDEAQLRFKKGSLLADNMYVRADGTISYFFALEEIDDLARQAGMEVQRSRVVRRQMQNRSKGEKRSRIWLQAVYSKK